MFQVTFSEQSLSELKQLDTLKQMALVDEVTHLSQTDLEKPGPAMGAFERENKTYYRIRAGEYRVYFERRDAETLYCHYILHKNTLQDFIFRTNLPASEETMAEQHQSFWKYLESLRKD
ncbi:MAG: type II toxin-antitoxin system RelE family toxin [Opitutales bacterium]